jgi:hypothetical protein
MVLLKPLSFRLLSFFGPRNQNRPFQRSSFDYKLSTFYTYLTALSFCDLFSCVFAILNVIEYITPPYLNNYSINFHRFFLSIALITQPIAITFQALSVWVITLFSIHRANTIMQTDSWSSEKTSKRNGEASVVITHSQILSEPTKCDDNYNKKENRSDVWLSIYFFNRFNNKTYNFKFKPTCLCLCGYCNKSDYYFFKSVISNEHNFFFLL